MLQYKYRKQLVINRKLPKYKFINNISMEFILSGLADCEDKRSTISVTKKNNHFIDNYEVLEHYDQKHTNLKLPPVFDVFGDIHDLRYGILPHDNKSLWGIEINKNDPHKHVTFRNIRNFNRLIF